MTADVELAELDARIVDLGFPPLDRPSYGVGTPGVMSERARLRQVLVAERARIIAADVAALEREPEPSCGYEVGGRPGLRP